MLEFCAGNTVDYSTKNQQQEDDQEDFDAQH